MKSCLSFYILLLFPFYLMAQTPDTTIQSVLVGFNYSSAIFPESWRPAPVNAYGEQIEAGEIARSKKVIAKALAKYPKDLLTYNLKGVYFLYEMKFYNVFFGGTNSADAVYLTNQGVAKGYTDKYLEQTFHHEFSSILLRNYPALLDTNLWKGANTGNFVYNDPENGVGALRNNQSSQQLDSLLCLRGILTQYGGSSLENDVNTFAQNLFSPEKNFWAFVSRFPRIREKATLLINFYNKISGIYTEQYFRKME
ncbi:MAG: hypothetical protein Q8941_08950 [Bacteroidota bacterium]|nr:hypothetical protein [Bacteroidota bacterium]